MKTYTVRGFLLISKDDLEIYMKRIGTTSVREALSRIRTDMITNERIHIADEIGAEKRRLEDDEESEGDE